MTVFWHNGILAMTSPGKSNIRAEWDKFISTLGEKSLKALREAGIDPEDPMALNDIASHRLFGMEGRGTEYTRHKESYFQRITKGEQIRKHREQSEEDVRDPVNEFAILVARHVLRAFECSRSREVRFHCDCIKLALGDPAMGSQKEICEKYGVSKAMLSWNVRKIQRRLDLPKCIFNGNRMKEGGRK